MSVLSGFEVVKVYHFTFNAREEVFSYGIVVGITFTAHGRYNFVSFQ